MEDKEFDESMKKRELHMEKNKSKDLVYTIIISLILFFGYLGYDYYSSYYSLTESPSGIESEDYNIGFFDNWFVGGIICIILSRIIFRKLRVRRAKKFWLG